jgi:glucose-6-phosphate isomerase
MEIKEAQLKQHWQQMLEGENVSKEQFYLKDASHFEEKNPSLPQGTLLMEVYTAKSSDQRGHLDWQSLVIYPHLIGDEYNMSHGFFHKRNDAQDYFWCAKGYGLLMIMRRNGECWCEEMEEGSLHHIDEDVAVRLINIGDEELIVSHCFPSEAGMDMQAVQERPFPCHIYDDNGEMCIRIDELLEEPSGEAPASFDEMISAVH